MYYEDDSGAANFVAGVLIGTIMGAGLALLLAPQSGRRTRRQLRHVVDVARDDALERWDDLTDDLKGAVDAGRRRLKL